MKYKAFYSANKSTIYRKKRSYAIHAQQYSYMHAYTCTMIDYYPHDTIPAASLRMVQIEKYIDAQVPFGSVCFTYLANK